MKLKRSTVQWTISIPPLLSKKAEQVARKESRTKSEFVREALRQYLSERDFHQAQNHLTRRLQALGIRTEEDVERLIDEGRH